MKKHILILMILAMSLPFLQGSNGCSGSVEFPLEGELPLEGEVDIMDQADVAVVEQAPLEPQVDYAGPVGIMQPEEPAEPALEPAKHIDSGVYIPDDSDKAALGMMRMKLNANLIEQISMDRAVFDAYANIFEKFASMLNIDVPVENFIAALDNVSFACDMDQNIVDAWNIRSCKGLVAIAVFDADATDVVGMLDYSFARLEIDENGSYKLKDNIVGNIVGRKIADNVYAFGTPDYVNQGMLAKTDNLFMVEKVNFEPSAMIFSANGAIADNVLANKMFAAFNVLPQVMRYIRMNDAIKMDYLGGVEYVNNPSIAAAAYVIADNIMPIKIALAMSYENLVEFIKSQERAVDTKDSFSATIPVGDVNGDGYEDIVVGSVGDMKDDADIDMKDDADIAANAVKPSENCVLSDPGCADTTIKGCGDGLITGSEQCDHKVEFQKNKGCPPHLICVDCQCVEPSEPSVGHP